MYMPSMHVLALQVTVQSSGGGTGGRGAGAPKNSKEGQSPSCFCADFCPRRRSPSNCMAHGVLVHECKSCAGNIKKISFSRLTARDRYGSGEPYRQDRRETVGCSTSLLSPPSPNSNVLRMPLPLQRISQDSYRKKGRCSKCRVGP